MGKRWYVVQSKLKREKEAYENLKNQRYGIFLPMIAETKVVRGRLVTIQTPLFPSYLFVQFDIKRSKWRSILGTRGVKHLLGSTDIYATPLPRGFIEDLQKHADRSGIVTIKSAVRAVSRYTPGDVVRVKDGLFTGLSGTCKKIQQNFITLIMALQSGNFELDLPIEVIEPL